MTIVPTTWSMHAPRLTARVRPEDAAHAARYVRYGNRHDAIHALEARGYRREVAVAMYEQALAARNRRM